MSTRDNARDVCGAPDEAFDDVSIGGLEQQRKEGQVLVIPAPTQRGPHLFSNEAPPHVSLIFRSKPKGGSLHITSGTLLRW
jgi:hypothetical protein